MSLLKNHLKSAHLIWKEHLQPDDLVIDATVGNGHDTLILSKLIPHGTLFALDLQQEALASAKKRCTAPHIAWHLRCHSSFPETIQENTIALITYNLGYLPGSTKEVITEKKTTLESLKSGLALLKPTGLITCICYTGHPGGKEEADAVLTFCQKLPTNLYTVEVRLWTQKQDHPFLLLIQKT